MSQVLDGQPANRKVVDADQTPLVSILMVGYNCKRFLDGCLGSIRERVTCSYEVILVDNASLDGSADYVEQHYPWVKLIRSERNLGFARGTNLAAKDAQGKYYLLLNVDTVLLTDIRPALSLLEHDSGIGIVGAQVFRGDGKLGVSTGWFPTAWRVWRVKNLWMIPRVRHGVPQTLVYKAEWVEGAFLMTTAENWRALSGLDEYYFLCADDMDFCRASLNRGLAAVQCPKIRYIHFGGHSPSRSKYLYAGFRHYHKKFSSPFHRFLVNAILRLGLLVRVIVFGACYGATKNQAVGDKWRGFMEAYTWWSHMAP